MCPSKCLWWYLVLCYSISLQEASSLRIGKLNRTDDSLMLPEAEAEDPMDIGEPLFGTTVGEIDQSLFESTAAEEMASSERWPGDRPGAVPRLEEIPTTEVENSSRQNSISSGDQRENLYEQDEDDLTNGDFYEMEALEAADGEPEEMGYEKDSNQRNGKAKKMKQKKGKKDSKKNNKGSKKTGSKSLKKAKSKEMNPKKTSKKDHGRGLALSQKGKESEARTLESVEDRRYQGKLPQKMKSKAGEREGKKSEVTWSTESDNMESQEAGEAYEITHKPLSEKAEATKGNKIGLSSQKPSKHTEENVNGVETKGLEALKGRGSFGKKKSSAGERKKLRNEDLFLDKTLHFKEGEVKNNITSTPVTFWPVIKVYCSNEKLWIGHVMMALALISVISAVLVLISTVNTLVNFILKRRPVGVWPLVISCFVLILCASVFVILQFAVGIQLKVELL